MCQNMEEKKNLSLLSLYPTTKYQKTNRIKRTKLNNVCKILFVTNKQNDTRSEFKKIKLKFNWKSPFAEFIQHPCTLQATISEPVPNIREFVLYIAIT